MSVAGDFTNNGVTFGAGSGTVTMTGSASTQIIGGTAATAFHSLTINKAAGGVTLGRDTTVGGTLALTSGVVSTGSYTLIVSSGGSVSRASCSAMSSSCFVAGNLRKSVAIGTSVALVHEIGTGSVYSPVSLTFASVSVAGTLTAAATAPIAHR